MLNLAYILKYSVLVRICIYGEVDDYILNFRKEPAKKNKTSMWDSGAGTVSGVTDKRLVIDNWKILENKNYYGKLKLTKRERVQIWKIELRNIGSL